MRDSGFTCGVCGNYFEEAFMLAREVPAGGGQQCIDCSWRDVKHWRPGTHGCHELLDRVSIILSNFNDFVEGHPALANDPQWSTLVDDIASRLMALYQSIGAEHLEHIEDDE